MHYPENQFGLSTIFLWIGYSAAYDKLPEEMKTRLSNEHDGQIGLADRVRLYAPIVDQVVAEDDRDYPGVFMYEIVEPMGAWLCANHGASPTEFRAELERRIDEWIFIGDCRVEACGEWYALRLQGKAIATFGNRDHAWTFARALYHHETGL